MQRREGEERRRELVKEPQTAVLGTTLRMKISDRTDTHTVQYKTDFAKDCS